MNRPLVAVVGRPNVGKSTFINKISGTRSSIVKDVPGVTRDRLYVDAQWNGRDFILVDTGGIDESKDSIAVSVKKQAYGAVELSDIVIFLVDGITGAVAQDDEIANILRRSNKPVFLAVNKLDNYQKEATYDFYKFGLGEPYPVSAEHGKGVADLLDALVAKFDVCDDDQDDDDGLRIAVIGKPNVGKSSIVNKICGFERVIVSDVAGTTRDSINTRVKVGDDNFVIVDTAGMRRKREIEYDSIESFAVMRAISAIKHCDVVFIVMDATQPISEQDCKIAGLAHEEGKPSVIVMNKWDAVEKDTYTIEKKVDELKKALAFMGYFKCIFISALTGLRLEKAFDLAKSVHENASRRITTGTLNTFIGEAVAASEPPSFSGRRLKIYYATQSDVCPPSFVFMVNDEKLVHFSYRRYLENRLRTTMDFSGTPIKMKFVGRGDKK